jgi:hypothetical protein
MSRVPLCVGNATTVRVGGGGNTGNLVHAIAARRILGPHHNKGGVRPWTDKEIEWIEANCSHIVYVAANALRVGAAGSAHEERLAHLADNIQRTSLPTLTLGLGGQAPSDFSGKPTLPDGAAKLLSVLGERSRSIAVRGAFTAEILNSFGVRNVTITGCQSALYWLKPTFTDSQITKPDAKAARVAFNYTSMGHEPPLINRAMMAGWFGIGQQHDGELALKRDPNADPGPQVQKAFDRGTLDRDAFVRWLSTSFEQFHDLQAWLDFLSANIDFSFGSRFHGNMAALLAGIRALWVIHDMRTQELVDHMKLPAVDLETAKASSLEELIERADYGPFAARYPHLYATLAKYLSDAGISSQLAS